MEKLLTRDEFREGVFTRDKHKCVFCDKPAVDAHHILERRLWGDGGYYMSNGASVCEEHHLACERTTLSVEDVRIAAGITKFSLPDQLYDGQIYDKWGNNVLEDGRRTRGELFYDESVQKVLKEGDALKHFTSYVKYGRTMHLPWSPGVQDDDKVIKSLKEFEGQRVIISEKRDGENTSFYSDHNHARSIDSKGGEDRAWVKQFWSTICHDIPEGWRVCGENLWAEHSIHYQNLDSYFEGFSIWDDKNQCLDWDTTIEYFELMGIKPVPVIYDGIWNETMVRKLNPDWKTCEGYVVRVARSFAYSEFKTCIAKWVREGHVQTSKHWRAGRQFIKNELK